MKSTLVPDPFKGTLGSSQVYTVMDEKIKKHFPDSLTASIPTADGGERSVDAFITAVGGAKEYVMTKNPYFEDMESYFRLIDAEQTAVIEMASYVGLPLVEDRKDPRFTATYGAGRLTPVAAHRGVKEIIVGPRGSLVNGEGCDVVAAVSIRFYGRDGRQFIPTGGAIADTDRTDLSRRDSLLEQVETVTVYGIDNPMYGPVGIPFVFELQKGVDKAMAPQSDGGIRNPSRVTAQATGANTSQVPGTGVAGAMGTGTIASSGSKLQTGVQTVLDTVQLDEIIGGADYILTGEGKLDSQSLWDKVVIGIAEGAKEQAESVIVVIGGADDDGIGKVCDMGVTAMLPINRLPRDLSISKHRSQENPVYTVDNVIGLIRARQEEH